MIFFVQITERAKTPISDQGLTMQWTNFRIYKQIQLPAHVLLDSDNTQVTGLLKYNGVCLSSCHEETVKSTTADQ